MFVTLLSRWLVPNTVSRVDNLDLVITVRGAQLLRGWFIQYLRSFGPGVFEVPVCLKPCPFCSVRLCFSVGYPLPKIGRSELPVP